MNTETLEIVTHSGIFHADEILAILILRGVYKNMPLKITRTRDQEKIRQALNSPNPYLFLVDVGEDFSPIVNHYDHHQNGGLPASNMLVWNELGTSCLHNISMVREYNVDVQLVASEMQMFMSAISDWDTNKNGVIQAAQALGVLTISQCISGFNGDPTDDDYQSIAFEKAMDFMREVFLNEVRSACARVRAQLIFDSRIEIAPQTYVFEKFCPIWKRGAKIAVLPNPQGWAIMSADSALYPLYSKEEAAAAGFAPAFCHAGKFLMVFRTQEEATECAKAIASHLQL